MTLPICFERLDWSLAIGYLVSATPALQLLIETLNVKKNYQIKWYGQERRRGIKWISLQFTVLLKLVIHIGFANSLWKNELVELFQITCSCGRSLVVIIGCGNFQSLSLYVIRMSLSTIFVLLHVDSGTLWLYNLSFDLLSKWILNLELIPSSQKENGNAGIQNSVYSFWSLADIDLFQTCGLLHLNVDS